MDVSDWQKRAGSVIDVGNLPSFSLKGRGGLVGKVALVLLVVIGLFSTYYQIDQKDVGVVQRFGKYVRTTAPGPHLKIPFIEKVTKVPVQRQLKAEFGFRTKVADVQSTYEEASPSTRNESQMLTGDLNVAVVEWIVQYKVKNPRDYLFNVRNLDSTSRRTETTFRDMNEAVMRGVIGDHSVNEVLTVGREIVQMEAKAQLQQLCERYETGIQIDQIVLQDVNPPDKVKPAFNEVNQAIQEKERLINEAWADYNQTVPNARGEAERAIRTAEGYALERVNNARGDVARFVNIYDEYRKAPEVTRRRLYLETLNDVLPKTGRKLIVDANMKGLLPLLNLDTIKQEPKQ
ncbi:MAG: FtsH protease activity modulator HflK [Acidobacteria bacterium]|nr:FtsH protease activity modulator HflK [Acidobacteriota bacterium]